MKISFSKSHDWNKQRMDPKIKIQWFKTNISMLLRIVTFINDDIYNMVLDQINECLISN